LLDAKIIGTGIDVEIGSHQHRSGKEIIGALLSSNDRSSRGAGRSASMVTMVDSTVMTRRKHQRKS
jgi:hypothetical protein